MIAHPRGNREKPTGAPRLLHSLRLEVRWGDMDALGHVNNAVYLRYFEQSRIVWLDGLGYGATAVGTGPILAKATVTFLKPILYPCELQVRLFTSRLGNTSFVVASDIVNGRDHEERFTEGEFVIVWLDYAAEKPVAVPQRLRDILAGTP